jgi:hypothetical protein
VWNGNSRRPEAVTSRGCLRTIRSRLACFSEPECHKVASTECGRPDPYASTYPAYPTHVLGTDHSGAISGRFHALPVAPCWRLSGLALESPGRFSPKVRPTLAYDGRDGSHPHLYRRVQPDIAPAKLRTDSVSRNMMHSSAVCSVGWRQDSGSGWLYSVVPRLPALAATMAHPGSLAAPGPRASCGG